MTSRTNALVWRGILGLVVGVVAVVWPGITVGAFVVLFAVYTFLAAGAEASRAFRSGRAGPVAGGLLLAAVDVVAGLTALAWPGITALALVWLVAIWAVVSGFVELAGAFAAAETVGERALLGLGGLVSVALGFIFAVRPDVGAETIAQVYGLFSIFAGISALVMAANVGTRQHSVGEFAPV